MEDCICINKTLLSKQQDREIYWSFLRWRGRAKAAFIAGICIDVVSFILLCVFSGFLLYDPYAGKELGYILLCVSCWLLSIIFALHTAFQGHFYANKGEKLRRKIKGRNPVYTEIEFYRDSLVFKSGVFDEVTQVPYSYIFACKETEHYCVLITTVGTSYTYGKEEFVQGSADEAYALIVKSCNKELFRL